MPCQLALVRTLPLTVLSGPRPEFWWAPSVKAVSDRCKGGRERRPGCSLADGRSEALPTAGTTVEETPRQTHGRRNAGISAGLSSFSQQGQNGLILD